MLDGVGGAYNYRSHTGTCTVIELEALISLTTCGHKHYTCTCTCMCCILDKMDPKEVAIDSCTYIVAKKLVSWEDIGRVVITEVVHVDSVSSFLSLDAS